MSTFIPSIQQTTFFQWIQEGTGSCVLEAVAGSGKTTTLIKALPLMAGSIFFGAYNKKIADEIKVKAPLMDDLTVSTMHAAGFAMWRRVAKNVKVESTKCRDIYREASSRYPSYMPFESAVLSLVSFAKQAGIGALVPINSKRAWRNLVEHFDIECNDEEDLVMALALKTLQKSIERDMDVIDFDDMIYAPLVHKVKAREYDWVLIDEAQDTNSTRRALALLMLKRGGRLVAVGDSRQAIYGFTGADHDALELIGQAVNAQHLPLTVSYRCPKAVVKYAQTWVNHIQAHEDAVEGTVSDLQGLITASAKPGDAILCRFNAPIIKLVYQFIAEGIPAKVEGREIGQGLKVLARRWKLKSFSALLDKLEAYRDSESAKHRAQENESKAIAVEDKVECLKVLIARIMRINPKATNPIEALCSEIDTLFDDNVGDNKVILSTIHKSKGREWNNVYWLQTGPAKWARMDWELRQEDNLCYVAATRAKQNLILAQVEQ